MSGHESRGDVPQQLSLVEAVKDSGGVGALEGAELLAHLFPDTNIVTRFGMWQTFLGTFERQLPDGRCVGCDPTRCGGYIIQRLGGIIDVSCPESRGNRYQVMGGMIDTEK